MASFTCPFCGCSVSKSRTNFRTHLMDFADCGFSSHGSHPYLSISIFRCANEDCKKETVIADGFNGYIENRHIPIYPEAVFRHYPEYVPSSIRQDYEEACLIRDRSPKAAATLARRCLQGMIHDFWDIHGKNLNAEITQLKNVVPAAQWQAIDAIRSIGNIGAHMEQDTSLIIDISADEAGQLLKMIELLIDKWYIARNDEQQLYNDLVTISSEMQKKRDPV